MKSMFPVIHILSFMSRILPIIVMVPLLLIGIIMESSAQTVIPFALKKQVINGIINDRSGEWLFLSLSGDVCYDSDNNGFTVNNGYLRKKDKNSEFTIYEGESYHGYCNYIIKNDYSKLNIVDIANNVIYVYEHCVPSSGVVTCGRIKEKRIKSTEKGLSPTVIERVPEKKIVTKREKCTYCNGKGSVKTYIGTMAYSDNGLTYWCSECNEIMHSYDKHFHQKCIYCTGGWREVSILE